MEIFLSSVGFLIFIYRRTVLKVSIDDHKRKFLKVSPWIDRHNARFSWQLYLPDSSPSRSMGRCECGTHFSTHASLEFFSFGFDTKSIFFVVQSSLHDLRSGLHSNNLSRIRRYQIHGL